MKMTLDIDGDSTDDVDAAFSVLGTTEHRFTVTLIVDGETRLKQGNIHRALEILEGLE